MLGKNRVSAGMLFMIKKLLKYVIRPISRMRRRFAQRTIQAGHGYFLHGVFSTWREAADKATGYTDPALVERVAARNITESRLAEREHHRLSDRDAQMFSAILIAIVNLQATNLLKVLDFGGEMGGRFSRSCPAFEA
jgi:hypothetical protein